MRATEQHIRALLRIVAAVLFVWVLPAHASFPPITNGYEYAAVGPTGATGAWFLDPQAAAQSVDAAYAANYGGRYTGPMRAQADDCPGSGFGQYAKLDGVDRRFYCLARRVAAPYCPANSTLSGGACSCNSGYDEQGGQCVANQCSATLGEARIVNVTTGYFRTPNDDDYDYVGGPPHFAGDTNVCSGGCTFSVGAPVQGWRSQVPTPQGLYRGSIDYESIGMGTACTVDQNAPENPNAPAPDCPGYVGELNGKTGCFGTADKPINPVTVPSPDKPLAGNPAAGPKPASGEGSGNDGAGRTPSTGNGGNAGGPSGAAQGGRGGGAGGASSGTGNTNKPGEGEEQEACGAPGQPECTVKINEKGTPGDPKNKQLEDGVNELKQAQQDALNNAENTAKGWFSGWGFGFSLPSGCTPLDMDGYEFSVNFCRWQSVIHDIMSIVWLMVTAWACIGMVGRTVRGGS